MTTFDKHSNEDVRQCYDIGDLISVALGKTYSDIQKLYIGFFFLSMI